MVALVPRSTTGIAHPQRIAPAGQEKFSRHRGASRFGRGTGGYARSSLHHRLISPQPSGLGIPIFNLLHKTSLAAERGLEALREVCGAVETIMGAVDPACGTNFRGFTSGA